MSFSSRKTAPNNVNLDESQTLQNKTLDGSTVIQDGATITTPAIIDPSRSDVKKDTLANLQTYASTASNGQLVYATDSKKMFQVLDGALAEVGGGSAGINYILNPDAEVNADGWSNYANTTPGELPDDFGGSLAIFWTGIAVNSSNPLRGSKSFVFGGDDQLGTEDMQGHGVYYDFNIDAADKAKKLTISFDYLIDDSSLTAADDEFFRVYVYDITNDKLIRVNGENIKLNANSNTHIAQFQTAADSTSYRLVIHQAKAMNVNDSYQFKLDNVQVGPREVVKGAAMTDWKEFTVINDNTNVTYSSLTGLYKRVGDTAHIRVKGVYSSGSGAFRIDISNIGNVDLSKYPNNQSFFYSSVHYNDTSANTYYGGGAYVPSGNVFWGFSEGSDAWDTANPVASGSGDNITWDIRVPIVGWSSNAVTSEDLGGREVVVQAYGNSAQVLTGNTTNIPFGTTEIEDTTSSWDGDQFTCPETGYYDVHYSLRYTTAIQGTFRLYIDGVATNYANVAEASTEFPNGDFISVPLSKGQVLSLRMDQNRTLNSSAPQLHRISIAKRSSPQTILETETVAARYTSNSGQTVNSSVSIFDFEDLEADSHNAMSAGTYTIPVSGWYNISAQIGASVNLSTAQVMQIRLHVDGSLHSYKSLHGSGAASTVEPSISTTLYLNKDQTVAINGFSSVSTTAYTDGTRNFFSIHRIK
jgi:hypothetical protein